MEHTKHLLYVLLENLVCIKFGNFNLEFWNRKCVGTLLNGIGYIWQHYYLIHKLADQKKQSKPDYLTFTWHMTTHDNRHSMQTLVAQLKRLNTAEALSEMHALILSLLVSIHRFTESNTLVSHDQIWIRITVSHWRCSHRPISSATPDWKHRQS